MISLAGTYASVQLLVAGRDGPMTGKFGYFSGRAVLETELEATPRVVLGAASTAC